MKRAFLNAASLAFKSVKKNHGMIFAAQCIRKFLKRSGSVEITAIKASRIEVVTAPITA